MRYRISHETRFTYAIPVRFARCNLRLKPIIWSGQTLIDHSLATIPSGEFSFGRADASLANVTRLVIPKAVTDLRIVSHAVVEVDRDVPEIRADDPDLATVAQQARESRDVSAASPANYLFSSPRIALDPAIVLARTSDPIFSPEEDYEKFGVVNGVVFPCGMVVKNKNLFIYYGGGDKVTGVATIKLSNIIETLLRGSKFEGM